ncbi:hypothetical protein NPIL_115141 [Nephila pilipes]|uniref:Uncharacterized protein n=1 Tax=Nephila pilipes TaxID=299642 RepID=A0A8X6JKT6_NEPPI|nr:hypothetical protein NPIL_115141 [Nephila pilipes]
MPKRKKDKIKKQKLWCETQMAEAIESVLEKKMGYLQKPKEFRIPIASLFRLVNSKEKNANVAASTALVHKPELPEELEDKLQT